MNWYEGSISDAVSLSRQMNAVFIVYVVAKESKQSQTIEQFLRDKRTEEKMNGDEFVAIRIEGDTESYMQFVNIYKNVPQPSIYFIGKSGAPIEIGTASDSIEDLHRKLQNAFDYVQSRRRGTELIRSLGASSCMTPTTASICESTIVVKSCNSILDLIENSSDVNLETPKENDSKFVVDEKLNENKCVEGEMNKFERDLNSEIRKRQKGVNINSNHDLKKEQELKTIREAIKRDRLAKNNERKLILEKFANDRVEQRNTLIISTNSTEVENKSITDVEQPTANLPEEELNSTKIQFRTPEGNTQTENFPNDSKFEIVREHVQNVVLKDSNIKSYTLSGNYPRREFSLNDNLLTLTELGLVPSAVILIIPKPTTIMPIMSKEGVTNSVSNHVNGFSSIIWILFSPIFNIVQYFQNIISKNSQNTGSSTNRMSPSNRSSNTNMKKICTFSSDINDGASTSGYSNTPNKDNKSNQSQRPANNSNIHQLRDKKSESDDDNNTWNGNSTQQQ